MKLTDLEPVFVRCTDGGHQEGATFAEAQGVNFWCPKCQGSEAHGLLVWFDDRGVPEDRKAFARWEVSGTSLDDLTLSPSINLPSCWHGWIRNGEVTSC